MHDILIINDHHLIVRHPRCLSSLEIERTRRINLASPQLIKSALTSSPLTWKFAALFSAGPVQGTKPHTSTYQKHTHAQSHTPVRSPPFIESIKPSSGHFIPSNIPRSIIFVWFIALLLDYPFPQCRQNMTIYSSIYIALSRPPFSCGLEDMSADSGVDCSLLETVELGNRVFCFDLRMIRTRNLIFLPSA